MALKAESAKKNYIYQFLYQALILMVPMVVSPYVSRVLGNTALGVYNYTNSIAYYFVIAAMLGISRYGQRTVALSRNNSTALSTSFWSLYCVHSVSSIVALAAYIVYVFCFCGSNVDIAAIQTIYVLSALFDITWLFQGLENFRSVVIKNAAVKVLEALCVFVFIRSPDDLPAYTLIYTLSTLCGQIIMLPQAIAAVKPIKFTAADIKAHIKPLFTLTIAVVAVAMYTVFDKTLLGLLSDMDDVAYYEYSNKIINIPKTFISIVATVMYPRACRFADNADSAGIKKINEVQSCCRRFHRHGVLLWTLGG